MTLLTCAAVLVDGDDLERRLEDRITEFTLLSNGMHFIVLERHKAPIVSCNTYANVGAFDEEDGKTGMCRSPAAFANPDAKPKS